MDVLRRIAEYRDEVFEEWFRRTFSSDLKQKEILKYKDFVKLVFDMYLDSLMSRDLDFKSLKSIVKFAIKKAVEEIPVITILKSFRVLKDIILEKLKPNPEEALELFKLIDEAHINAMSTVVEKREEKLRRYERFFRNAEDLFFVLDSDGRFIDLNPKFAERFGYKPEELIGKTSKILTHPEDLDRLRRFFKDVVNGETKRGEFRFITRDGEVLWFEVVEWPVFKENKAVEVEGISRDITKRKKIERRLKESEERFKTLAEMAPFAIIVYQDSVIKYINSTAEKLLGYSRDEIVGKTFWKIIHPDFYDVVKQKAEARLRGEYVEPYELKIVTKSGVEKWVYVTGSSVIWDGKKAAIVSLVDITRLKELEKSLEERNEILRLINRILRHDILNKLTVTHGYLEIYRNSRDERFLEKVFESIDSAIKLICSMRELESLIFDGKADLKPIKLREVVEEVARGYDIEINVEGDCRVLADEAISSAIDNVIRNAVKHGKTERIDVKIEERGDYCEMRIADYGVGIPDEFKENVFKQGFAYGENAGMGLGLYIVKKLVERYGGSVEIEDNKPKGTVFVFKFKKVYDEALSSGNSS